MDACIKVCISYVITDILYSLSGIHLRECVSAGTHTLTHIHRYLKVHAKKITYITVLGIYLAYLSVDITTNDVKKNAEHSRLETADQLLDLS